MRDFDRLFRNQPNYRIPGIFIDLERGKNAMRPQSITQQQIAPAFDTSVVKKVLFDAHTILYAISDDTPVALTVGASTIVGRKSSGNIVALTATELATILSGASPDIAVVSKSGAYTLTGSDCLVLCDATGGAFTITLPAKSGIDGRMYIIKKTDSSANAIIVDGNGAETIDGGATASITVQYESITIICGSSEWHIV